MVELESEAMTQKAVDRDAGLWRALLEAAPGAAQELCVRFGVRLLAFAAARFPKDRQLAEDVMVQSLATAAGHIKWYNPRKSSFAAWLYGVARRQIQDELRRQRRMKSLPAAAQVPLEGEADLADEVDVAELVAARVDAERAVAEVGRALSEVELDVLVLSSIDELSAREIGRVVGRSERAVHSLLHRARAKARERLTRDEQ